nr:hypothetical protein [Tanacetum cinerariifolium]
AARWWLEKEPPHSITTWDDLKFDESFHEAWERYKDLLRACPHHGFTELHQLDTFYNALNPADQDSLNAAAGVNACDNHSSSELAKLIHAVNQQTSAVTTAMTAIVKQLQSNPPPAQVKAVEEIRVTCGGAHPYYQCLAAGGNTFPEYRDNIQGYVSPATGNYNHGNDPSFFLKNKTGAPQGEELGLIKPLLDSSFSCFATLSFQEVPIGKVPVLPEQHWVSNQFGIPLVGSEEDPVSPREIL